MGPDAFIDASPTWMIEGGYELVGGLVWSYAEQMIGLELSRALFHPAA
jgi:hypothetical protein